MTALELDPDELAYPAQFARTRRFTLGVPRAFTVAADGSRVAYLRSRAGDDPIMCLWVLDVAAGTERLVVDPRSLLDDIDEHDRLSATERARRERARESAGGIVAYGADRDLRAAAFALGAHLFVADLVRGGAAELPTHGPADDPRLDPTGRRLAYVVEGALHVRTLDGDDRVIAADEDPDVTWGLAEFVAAEEMDRPRGYWWSPDGERLAATRVDASAVSPWFIADPTHPEAEPRAIRYPAAGTANADVTLAVFEAAGGRGTDVEWDREASPYLARVEWAAGSPLTMLVQSRDQRTAAIVEVNESGRAIVVWRETDPAWVDLAHGSPSRMEDGRLATISDRLGVRALVVGGEVVTDPGIHVRSILAADRDVFVEAWPAEDPTSLGVYRVVLDARGGRSVRSFGSVRGIGTATVGGDVVVIAARDEAAVHPTVSVRPRDPDADARDATTISVVAEEPLVDPRPEYLSVGERDLRCALLLPRGWSPERPLPVLLDPYGGPRNQRVVRTRGAYLTSQWFADRGFAVLVADGRGTPGRGPAWERAIRGDLSTALEDQVDALRGAAARRPEALDVARVAIRGWSFGGYLAALAVLRRPDVFHAAIAGAPVTDWRLYDTHYTERYLGHPDEQPGAYRRSSVVEDAPALERPLLLIHGLADDNVVAAHTLRLSAELYEAGRRHELVLLPRETHMAASGARRRLALELDFLRRSLGVAGVSEAT